MGSESKFQEDFCDMLVKHMERGLSFESFGAVIGITPNRMQKWLKRYPQWQEAKETGEARSLLFWESLGIAGITAGKGFNAAVWMFSMKNRFRKFGWKDKWLEDDAPTVAIQQTVQLSPSQLKELVLAARGEKEAIDVNARPALPPGFTAADAEPDRVTTEEADGDAE